MGLGFHRGIVTNVSDPEGRNRVKCKIPDLLGPDIESAWCEPCIPYLFYVNPETGQPLPCGFYLPQVGQAVWIAFENDNTNRPVYMGTW